MRMVCLLLENVVFAEKTPFKVDRVCRCESKVPCGCGTGRHSNGYDHCLMCGKYFKALPTVAQKLEEHALKNTALAEANRNGSKAQKKDKEDKI